MITAILAVVFSLRGGRIRSMRTFRHRFPTLAETAVSSIRQGAPFAYVELIFSVDSQEKRESLKEMDVFPDENGILIVSRKIMPSRSVSRINDETVTMARLRQITGLLLDIHGQHEHQSLLYKSKTS